MKHKGKSSTESTEGGTESPHETHGPAYSSEGHKYLILTSWLRTCHVYEVSDSLMYMGFPCTHMY